MREQHIFYQGLNRGFLSAVVNDNRCRFNLNTRSESHNGQYVNFLGDISLYSLSKISGNRRYREGIILKHFQSQVSGHPALLLNQGEGE